MKNQIKLIAALIVASLTHTAAAHTKSVVELHTTRRSLAPDGLKIEHSKGTGFYVRRRLIATAKHVVAGIKRVSIRRGKSRFHGRVVYESEKHDIAFVRVLRRGVPYDICEGIEHSNFIDVVLRSNGKLRIKADILEQGPIYPYWSTNFAFPGDSGSPALNGECLMGMLVASHSVYAPSLYEGYEHIQEALDDYERKDSK